MTENEQKSLVFFFVKKGSYFPPAGKNYDDDFFFFFNRITMKPLQQLLEDDSRSFRAATSCIA